MAGGADAGHMPCSLLTYCCAAMPVSLLLAPPPYQWCHSVGSVAARLIHTENRLTGLTHYGNMPVPLTNREEPDKI